MDKAYEFKLGARGLRTLCEAILNDAMFNLPSSGENELKITKLYADEKLQKIDLSYLKAVSKFIEINSSINSLEFDNLGTLFCPPSLFLDESQS